MPLDKIRLPVKARPDKSCTDCIEVNIPILAPHLLTAWLLETKRIQFDGQAAKQFWSHHRDQQTPWMLRQSFNEESCQPFGLWADEAEYTISKEKIFVLLARDLATTPLAIWVFFKGVSYALPEYRCGSLLAQVFL